MHKLVLSVPPVTYDWDSPYCALLHQCMDWSQLRLLDLGLSCLAPFFEEIRGSLPNPWSLTIGVQIGEDNVIIWHYTPSLHRPIIRVIDTVRGLQEVSITDLDSFTQVLSSTISKSQKASRSSLSICSIAHLASIVLVHTCTTTGSSRAVP